MGYNPEYENDFRELTEKGKKGYVLKTIKGITARGRWTNGFIKFSSKMVGKKVKVQICDDEF